MQTDLRTGSFYAGGRLVGRRGEWVKHRKLNAHDALSMVDALNFRGMEENLRSGLFPLELHCCWCLLMLR